MTIAGTEVVASFVAPPLAGARSAAGFRRGLRDRKSSAFADMPQLVPVYNEWGRLSGRSSARRRT